MRTLFIPLLLVVCYSCHTANKENSTVATTTSTDTTTISWIDDFRQFREAVYKGDVKETEAYFNFPIMDSTDLIWTLAKPGADPDTSTVPFTEEDFVQYYKKIFHPEFIKSLLKIKTEDLYKNNFVSSGVLPLDSTTNCWMDASFDKDKRILSLTLYNKLIEKASEGDIPDDGESSIAYFFIVQKNGHLLFQSIGMTD